jgi:hypothetical protein
MMFMRGNTIVVLFIFSLAAMGPLCRTVSLKDKSGFTVLNRSSHRVRIEMLRRIAFTDRSTTPWMREYTYYIHEQDPLIIRPGEEKLIHIEDGYYGISLCDGLLCTAKNFRKRGGLALIIEDGADKRHTTYRFVE